MNKTDDDSEKLFFAQMTSRNTDIVRFFDGGTLHIHPTKEHAEMFYKERIQPVFDEVSCMKKVEIKITGNTTQSFCDVCSVSVGGKEVFKIDTKEKMIIISDDQYKNMMGKSCGINKYADVRQWIQVELENFDENFFDGDACVNDN